MRRFKEKIINYIYKQVTKLYITLSNNIHNNFKPLVDGYDYGVFERFRNCNLSIYNPIECIYFAINAVYKSPQWLNIQGITMEYPSDNFIKINIHTIRSGLIIGKNGSKIDLFTKILTEYFGKKVEINLIQIKTAFTYSCL